VAECSCQYLSLSAVCSAKVVSVYMLDMADKLKLVDKFCYLGDMLGKGGGAEKASRTRVMCVWGKFNELAPILTARGGLHEVKAKNLQ